MLAAIGIIGKHYKLIGTLGTLGLLLVSIGTCRHKHKSLEEARANVVQCRSTNEVLLNELERGKEACQRAIQTQETAKEAVAKGGQDIRSWRPTAPYSDAQVQAVTEETEENQTPQMPDNSFTAHYNDTVLDVLRKASSGCGKETGGAEDARGNTCHPNTNPVQTKR